MACLLKIRTWQDISDMTVSTEIFEWFASHIEEWLIEVVASHSRVSLESAEQAAHASISIST